MLFLKQKSKAFTLIELLVVVAIIALLANVAILALNNARVKARNARRKADITQIRTAIELYFQDNQTYPNGGTVGNPNQETDIQNLSSFLVPTYMPSIPNDPKGPENYQYVWKQIVGEDYSVLAPFSNDDGTDCQWRTSGGSKNWFNKAPDCAY